MSASPRGTLSHRLVWQTTALVAAVIIVISGVHVLSNRQILLNALDAQLVAALSRSPGAQYGRGTTTQTADLAASGLIRIDQAGDDVLVQMPGSMPDATITALLAVPPGAAPSTMDVAGLGPYRFVARQTGGGRGGPVLTVVGLPMSIVTRPVQGQLMVSGLLLLVAIVGSYLGARTIVARSLRPLNRLAAVANNVSALRLERGEGAVPVRVDAADTNPASEVGQVGLAFNHMLDNVENALAVRHRSETKVRQFVADASHELRNPLASIRGYAELTARNRDDLPTDTAHALERIEAESDRMSDLVEDLLLLARLDSEPTLDFQPTDITELVVTAVDAARAASPDDHWQLDVPDGEVTVWADARRLHQVIANLLANARTHTPAGTTIVTCVRTEPGQAIVEVTDDGPGIPPDLLSRAFERFTRGDPARLRRAGASSTGLGLAIVHAVVTAHGGTVAVESQPGRTRFTVRLALAQGVG